VPGDPSRRKAVGEGARGDGVYPAETSVEPIARNAAMTLWRARCRTGVTHQVRVHLASIGFPLVGDALYDPDFAARPIRPEHHWLRAVRLAGSFGHFDAPDTAFRALPETEPPLAR
jgi:23S rRNA-/tRNA-specific pseudouridylate synthase